MPRINRPGTASIVNRALKAFGGSFGVAMPGVVQSYDKTTETAVVTPAIARLLPAEDNEDEDEVEYLPDLPSVPVLWFRARGVSMVGELQKGDPVLLICCDRDISAWRRSGDVVEPDTAREHHWHASFAIPGVEADQGAPQGNFPVPSDAAALASMLDLLIKAIKGSAGNGAGGAADWTAFKTTITNLFPSFGTQVPAVSPVPGVSRTESTSASERLKLDK